MLFAFGWHSNILFGCLFVAFVPLLFLQKDFSKNKKPTYQLLQYVFVAFLLFTILCTYWLAQYSFLKALSVWLYHTLCLSAVFMAFYISSNFFGKMVGYMAFVSFYLGFEFLTVNTNCFWPWLNLGNGLAGQPVLVQWYEYTGAAGGSLWILLVNLLLFLFIEQWFSLKIMNRKKLIGVTALIIIPVMVSLWLGFANTLIKYQKDKVAIVQPNVNSYQYKLTELSQQNNAITKDHIIPILQHLTEEEYDYIVLPETTFSTILNLEDSTSNNSPVSFLKKYLKQNGQLIYGAYATNKEKEKFNTAVFESEENRSFYIKQKLVPGTEILPVIGDFFNSKTTSFEKKYYHSITKHGYATQAQFPTAICYESIFGAAVAAQASYKNKPIIILTNDGWFDNTPLINQHLNIAKLRAIENRSYVVRSANSGISAIISNTGGIMDYLPNNKAGVIEALVPKTHLTKTFYQKYTDLIYRIGALISLILLLYIIVANCTHNFKFKKLGFT